jgi:type II secretory pathway predicted ATPase ExeA
MSYIGYFHFDAAPFPVSGEPGYFFENRRQTAVLEDVLSRVRVVPGVYVVTGGPGVGKTVLLRRIWRELSNNDAAVFVSATDRTDLLRAIADVLAPDSRRKAAPDVFPMIERFHKRGQNVVLLVDDAESLSAAARVSLASLVSAVPYLRVVMAGSARLKKMVRDRKLPAFRERLVGSYRVRHLPFMAAVRYVTSISIAALSLSQYRKVVPLVPAFAIAFAANRNMRTINMVATYALEDAEKNGRPRVGLSNVLHAVRANWGAAKDSIYQKFRKIFISLLVLLSLYFAVKIAVDRSELIKAMEVMQSIEEQERSFEDMTLEM